MLQPRLHIVVEHHTTFTTTKLLYCARTEIWSHNNFQNCLVARSIHRQMAIIFTNEGVKNRYLTVNYRSRNHNLHSILVTVFFNLASIFFRPNCVFFRCGYWRKTNAFRQFISLFSRNLPLSSQKNARCSLWASVRGCTEEIRQNLVLRSHLIFSKLQLRQQTLLQQFFE